MTAEPDFPDRPFTLADALVKLGLTRHRLDQAVENRQVRRVLTGVYVRADIPDSPKIRAQAAALVVTPFSVVCDRTAGWLHEVDVFDYRELELLAPLETYVLRGHAPTNRPECTGGERDLSASDISFIEGVAVTTPLRTALDLGCKLSRRRALAALDAFMRVHGITHEQLRREMRRYFRRRGVRQLRQLVPLADPRSESSRESWARLAIIDSGLPAPEPQVWVYVDGEPLFRLDLAYPKSRVAIEYDGEEFHSTPEQREHDRKRREWLSLHGWTVIVITKDSFAPEALTAWLRELRLALRQAA